MADLDQNNEEFTLTGQQPPVTTPTTPTSKAQAISTARQQGYSDMEIAQHLAGQNYATARNEGYSDVDILAHYGDTGHPFIQAAKQVGSALTAPFTSNYSPIGAAKTAMGAVGPAFDQAGAATTDFLGTHGVPGPVAGSAGGIIANAPAIAGAVGGISAAPEIGEAAENLPGLLKGLLPNPTLREMGAAAGDVTNPTTQAAARGAYDFATNPHPELAQILSKVSPSQTTALTLPGGMGESDLADIAPGQNTTIFNQPGIKGAQFSDQEAQSILAEQHKQIGEGIGKFYKAADDVGGGYAPSVPLRSLDSMLYKNPDGSLMDTGLQGAKNKALQDVMHTIGNAAQDEPMQWSDAGRLKTDLQQVPDYAADDFSTAKKEAYRTGANLVREDIDSKILPVLGQTKLNLNDFQTLRKAYGDSSTALDFINPEGGKEMLGPQTFGQKAYATAKKYAPYAGAGALGGAAIGILKGLTK